MYCGKAQSSEHITGTGWRAGGGKGVADKSIGGTRYMFYYAVFHAIVRAQAKCCSITLTFRNRGSLIMQGRLIIKKGPTLVHEFAKKKKKKKCSLYFIMQYGLW